MLNLSEFKILSKVIVHVFYKENAGLLFTFLLLCFGLFKGVDMMIEAHYGMMLAIGSNPFALLAALLIWAAYGIKTVVLANREIQQPKNEFLKTLGLAPPSTTITLLATVQMYLLLPIIIYAAVTVFVCLHAGFYISSLFIIVYIGLWSLLPAVWHTLRLRYPHKNWGAALLPKTPSISVPLPYFWYFYRHLLQGEKPLLLVSKSISLTLLWFGFYLIEKQQLAIQFLYVCMVGAATSHLVLIQKLRDFEDAYMPWMLNLPLKPFKRFVGYLLFFLLALLPEVVLVVRYSNTSGIDTFWLAADCVMIGLSIMAYFKSSLFKKGMNPEKFLNQACFAWLAFTMLMQFRVPALLFFLFVLSWSFFLYQKRYYLYEIPIPPQE